jgi:glucosamine-6-phosphate deaminase
MEIIVSENKQELGREAAEKGALLIRNAIQENGEANIIVATGASQFEMLTELVKEDDDWSKVTAFHLDEYIGILDTQPASFRKYLKERFADKVPSSILKEHKATWLYLDKFSASLLS